MPGKEILLLWVINAFNEKQGSLYPVYAHSEVEARQQANGWMIEQAMLGLRNIEAKCYPGGFLAGQKTWWPGSIPALPAGESEGQHADKQ